MRIDKPLNLDGDLRALGAEVLELFREARQDDAHAVRADNHDHLLGDGLQDRSREAFAAVRCELSDPASEICRAEYREVRYREVALQEINDGWVNEMRAKYPLERGTDLREQSADAAAHRGHLSREVVIETAEHGEFSDLLVRELDGSEPVRERAASVMVAASLGSVLATPTWRPAMRRIASPCG